MRTITKIVIHCSASPNGKPHTIADIDAWHGARGFLRKEPLGSAPTLIHIGYHRVIEMDGKVRLGRALYEVGAHVKNGNANSVGVCLVGTDKFTPAQWRGLYNCIRDLKAQFPRAEVVGHRDLSPDLDGDGVIERNEWLKTCPGFDVAEWVKLGMAPLKGHIMGEK